MLEPVPASTLAGDQEQAARVGTMETEGAWACSRGQHPVPYHPHPAVESTDLEQDRQLLILSLALREERVIKKKKICPV